MKKRNLALAGLLASTLLLTGAVCVHAEEEAPPLYTRLETLGHDYQLQDDSYEATDTEGGYRHYVCTDCGDEYDYHTDPLVYTTNPKTGEPVTQDGVHNPILPSWEHVPDGEPQVCWSKEDNEWRVYIYGSHDWRGDGFCYTDYVVWSAPVYDMSDWRYDGICLDITDGSIYGGKILYAPDVAYDLQTDTYYQVANEAYSSIVLRASDNPAGPWDKDQAVWTISFKQAYDPTVYCEDGKIYVSGACRRDEEWIMDPAVYQATIDDNYSEGSGQLAVIYQLKDDPQDGDGIEAVSYMPTDEHIYNPIYEGPSLYGWCEDLGCYLYLFVSNEFGVDGMYDSGIGYMWTDDLMNGIWHYGDNGIENDVPEGVAQEQIGGHGNIISDTSGRIYRDYKTGEMTFADFATYLHANNHGSMEKINGKWYVNGHRHCGGYMFARQAVMGQITVEKKEDGTPLITPMELTSSGPADSLDAYSVWDAGCVAYLLEAADIPAPEATKELIESGPYITATWDEAATHASYLTRLENGNIAGYKYINFGDAEANVALKMLINKADGAVDGSAQVLIDAPSEEEGGTVIGTMDLSAAALEGGETEEATDGTVWTWTKSAMDSPVSGTHAVYLIFASEEKGEICSFDQFTFEAE